MSVLERAKYSAKTGPASPRNADGAGDLLRTLSREGSPRCRSHSPVGRPYVAASTIARIPALTGSGSVGHALTTAANSGVFRSKSVSRSVSSGSALS